MSKKELEVAQKGKRYLDSLAVCNAGTGWPELQTYRCSSCNLEFGRDFFGFCVHVGRTHAK